MAFAPLDPQGDQGPGRTHVAHHVDLPLAVPCRVGLVGPAAAGEAGVGKPEGDGPDGGLDVGDQTIGGVLVGDIEAPGRHRTGKTRRGFDIGGDTAAAPAPTKARTRAPPIPPAAPVTTATRPAGSMGPKLAIGTSGVTRDV